MRYAVVSCSLNPQSRSRSLARSACDRIRALGQNVDLIDLAEYPLPLCDGAVTYVDETVQALRMRAAAADGILMAVPIYNYDVNAACKNFIELTGREVWTHKVCGFLCAAGGASSYMSVMAVSNSLMLDFRTYVIPRFLYCQGDDFDDAGQLVSPGIRERLDGLVAEFTAVTPALRRALTAS